MEPVGDGTFVEGITWVLEENLRTEGRLPNVYAFLVLLLDVGINIGFVMSKITWLTLHSTLMYRNSITTVFQRPLPGYSASTSDGIVTGLIVDFVAPMEGHFPPLKAWHQTRTASPYYLQ
ncbi:hypothetical protein BofuT4_P121040.1 [Botrytis cinerea T4]|uniref:Uncharacterized protein n=1 Tax=Botryotinia fuckeliana (strain T4) TaxID=999810 RepID=G2YN87_BOTF4|nr:hypothetical protein BofuT4_P121040.1 [Botrytis cinerea T4]